jgi:hypothetical protein
MISFRTFIENINMTSPEVSGNMLIYDLGTNFLLRPGASFELKIPETHSHLVLRDIILAHRKGPYGHGEPNMKWEPAKNKWRDYYGAYTKVEVHDSITNKWHTYVDDYGAHFKFAEHRPGDWEEETLHDIIKIGKIYPDVVKITNPGNQRASTNPITGEKVDPMDERSTVQIKSLKFIFFPQHALENNIKYYERFYSKKGGPNDDTPRFGNYNSKQESAPVYGNYGAGIYPDALFLAADWGRQSKRIRQLDGQWHFVMDKLSLDKIAGELGNRIERAGGKNNTYTHNNKEYVKVFPLTRDPGQGAEVKNNVLYIDVPDDFVNKKVAVVEVQCGDTELRPDRIEWDKPWRRLGYASLYMGLIQSGNKYYFNKDGISVAPQMVASAGPEQAIQVKKGDKIFIESRQDTTYVMGWRIGFVD